MQCLQCWGYCTHLPLYAHAGTVQLINNAPKQTDPRVEQLLEPHELALYNSTTKPGKLCSAMLQALTASAGFTEEKEVYISGMLGQVSSSVRFQGSSCRQCPMVSAMISYNVCYTEAVFFPTGQGCSLPCPIPNARLVCSLRAAGCNQLDICTVAVMANDDVGTRKTCDSA